MITLVIIIILLLYPIQIQAQIAPSASDAFLTSTISGQTEFTEQSLYPRIAEITGDFITINQGENYWIQEGQICEIWRHQPDIGESQKIGQARITEVSIATSTALILGEPTVSVKVDDIVSIHPEIVQTDVGVITIGWGRDHGLVAGWVVTLWRFVPVTQQAKVRQIVGRAILTDVQPEIAIARILGKPQKEPLLKDFIRIDRRTTIRQKSGNTVYLNIATDLIHILKPDMQVYAFRPYALLLPYDSQRVIRWKEQIATLKINHIAMASYIARASIDGTLKQEVLPEDLIMLEDLQMHNRTKAYKKVHILKTEPEHLFLNRFEEAEKGIQLTIVRKKLMSDEIDPTAPVCNLQVKAVYEHVVIASFLKQIPANTFHIGDEVRYSVYH